MSPSTLLIDPVSGQWPTVDRSEGTFAHVLYLPVNRRNEGRRRRRHCLPHNYPRLLTLPIRVNQGPDGGRGRQRSGKWERGDAAVAVCSVGPRRWQNGGRGPARSRPLGRAERALDSQIAALKGPQQNGKCLQSCPTDQKHGETCDWAGTFRRP